MRRDNVYFPPDRYKLARFALLFVLAAAAVFLLVEAALLAQDARKRLDAAAPQARALADQAGTALTAIEAIQTDTTRTEAEMAGLLNQTRHSMMTPAQTRELVDKAAALLDQANAATVKLGNAADSLEAASGTTESAIAQVTGDVRSSLQASQQMMGAATEDLNDPAIHQTLDATENAAKQTAIATANVADATTDIKTYVHRETAPARGFWNSVKALINLTWAIRGAAGL